VICWRKSQIRFAVSNTCSRLSALHDPNMYIGFFKTA